MTSYRHRLTGGITPRPSGERRIAGIQDCSGCFGEKLVGNEIFAETKVSGSLRYILHLRRLHVDAQ